MASYLLSSTGAPVDVTSYAPLPEDQFFARDDATDHKEGMRRRKVFQCWLPELFASLLSVASFVSLIAVLRHYQGRGIHDLHLPSSLTLNGLVAILSTLIRVSLMVPIGSAISQEVWLWLSKPQNNRGQLQNLEFSDAASRGSWGSLIFLVRARTSWLACSGALVTIISLGFGTFTQQLLIFKSFQVADPVPSILRTERWDGFVRNPPENAITIPLDLKVATLNGILNSNLLPLSALCPTSNCTWPITPSIAVCGACSNPTVQQSCNSTICQYKMPSGNEPNLTGSAAPYYNIGDSVSFQVMESPGAIYQQNDSTLYISNFKVVGSPLGTPELEGVQLPYSSTVASECALWMCVQAFEVNANQTEVVVQESSQVKNATTAITQGGDLATITFQDIPRTMNPSPYGNYTAGLGAYRAFQSYLSPTFNGSLSVLADSTVASSDVIEAIWNSAGDLDKWIKAVATSLTNAIRANKNNLGATQDTNYNGQAYQLGYDVRWSWIILPVVLVVWSVIILATTMIKTARSPVGAWKGSPLAILFMDVDNQIKKPAIGQLGVHNGLQKSVGRIKVKMEADQAGRWFVKRV